MRTAFGSFGLVAIAALGLLACNLPQGGNAFSPSPGFVDGLRRNAEALARQEMARMQQAELIYKDSVVVDLNIHHPFNTELGVVYKKYRNFTGYKVADIRRTDSLLAPLRFEIVFDYQLMGTKPHPNDLENAHQLAESDTEFGVLRERHMLRVYDSDMHGNLLETAPGLPPPDSIYEPGPGMWGKGDPVPPSVSQSVRRQMDVWREGEEAPNTSLHH